MKKLLQLLMLIAITPFSCTDPIKLKAGFLTSEKEVELLKSCRNTPLTTIEAIKENLIGDWELLGYGCTLCRPHESPTAFLTFTKEGGTIKYTSQFEDEFFEFEWSLQARSNQENTFYLETTPVFRPLQLIDFCEDFIIQDQRAGDGTMHIYQKR